MIDLTCTVCGVAYRVTPYRAAISKYCSPECRSANTAEWASRPIVDRFWEKVDKRGADKCWPWVGATTFGGYGVIGKGRGKLIRAHRLSYEMHTGQLSETEVVRHICDNPACVNPRHLVKGTQKDNMRDKVERGREYRPPGKLSDAALAEIRGGASGVRTLARKYGVSPGLVSMIRSGKRRIKG